MAEVKQRTLELRAIVMEADPTFAKNHRFMKEYEFSGKRQFYADYQRRGPYSSTLNVEDDLQTNPEGWPNYDSADYFGGPNDV